MNRQDYIYQLTGRITDKRAKRKKDGKLFWQLSTIIKDKPVNKINVFDNGLKNSQIWSEIEESEYIGKEYLFYCKNFMGRYFLVDWKELSSSFPKELDNSFSSERAKELKNYGNN